MKSLFLDSDVSIIVESPQENNIYRELILRECHSVVRRLTYDNTISDYIGMVIQCILIMLTDLS